MTTTNASNATPAPKRLVRTISRTSPSNLEMKVQKLTRPLLTSSLIDFFGGTILLLLEFSLEPLRCHQMVLNLKILNLCNILTP